MSFDIKHFHDHWNLSYLSHITDYMRHHFVTLIYHSCTEIGIFYILLTVHLRIIL